MAFFDINPTSSTGVEIAAASTGNRARFVAIGFSNDDTVQRTLLIYDGTAAAGTVRTRISLAAGSGAYSVIDQAGKSIFPKTWFTAGSAIECALSGSGSVRVWGEVVRES